MDQQEQSCKKHDFFMQSTREAFMRTCLSCGFVEELQLSQGKRKVDPWQGWLSAKIQPLSWPPCIKYSGTLQVYSYRPNMQTSLQSQPQMDRNPYIYRDLPKTSCIRLLEPLQGYRLDALSGRLFEVRWEQETCPSYSALSYTWADDKGDISPSNLIFLDEEQRVLRITRNCDRALRGLRQKNKSSLLWVDSICINQSSASERSHQVGLMKTIYSKATTVHAYVGEKECREDLTGTEAITLLKEIQGNGISSMLSGETSNIAILNNFFSRSYFARLWIVQELLLSQSITFHCGEVSLPVSNQSISQLYEQGIKVPSWVRFAGKAKSNTERTPMDLKDLLIATSVCRVTDLRDKVFGLLGLVSDVQASDLSPDYELMHIDPHRNQESLYGMPSWVPMWNTDMPLQGSENISRHIQQIELDCKRLPTYDSRVDNFTIRAIDGWSHDKISDCNNRGKLCKTVHSGSGFLASNIQTIPQTRTANGLEDNKYITTFWHLKGNIKIAVRRYRRPFWDARPLGCAHLIRVDGCALLFLACKTSDSLQYRLDSSCVAAIVCHIREPSPGGILKFDDLRRFSQFIPLTLEMVQFIAKWRNAVLTIASSDPADREHPPSIEDQSCHHSSLNEQEIYRPTWRSWGPFLALETWHMSENDIELQRQLPSLAEFWDKAHILHTWVRKWTMSALNLRKYRFTVLRHSNGLYPLERALRDCLGMSNALAGTFESIIGNNFTLQSFRLLEQLVDALTNPWHECVGSNLLGYQGTIEAKDIHPEYSHIKQTMEWKKVLTGLVRTDTEIEYVSFI
ncbi:heterokaryon incompatibility protein-domain-containing protein [Fusarium redolens]|uniref:Heterokaryon incompatibility protein-domain-containing protein n=1 Tax=Fusarium redolens TaxID=48865 RepID=A0A9P9G1E6_FUSRE|nr:heterokaryon incompatibility protein-domain-containing protein [Fusarium redolens]KAH7230523.1 heterokaryon incompatibility protein-domain-containing protein [Fusarium redolens]